MRPYVHPPDRDADRAASSARRPHDVFAAVPRALRQNRPHRRVDNVRARPRRVEPQEVYQESDTRQRGQHDPRLPEVVQAILLREQSEVSALVDARVLNDEEVENHCATLNNFQEHRLTDGPEDMPARD